ncbi:helicase-related protein [Pseudomonas aeruginosa]|uniref:helicase-related protein n=1 Tax=Pseudomonas aeruginosa TaxID=287 RepID=UPI0011B94CE2|nr:helicase-related protein [Pseudomonas aeruginosa]EIU2785513.1 DEAD/DEAH box helicase family protein [Pseudomonas aeruginosa]EKV3125048.1 DEAD/DEAH box helicase family protein [Pseudomonas aeruginosa]EKV3132270.1 DEAD/DEAH box helicase family protein [Pseudomonas aeruginosa]EKV4220398.1 DEAD/DEAH box helicase family protein [Pseudomonas aeruginosa]EKV5245354.1 DEAD/DEAH box helicase family protein [Pseudomonas aeruginosa]
MKLIQNTGTQRVIDLMRPHLKHGNRLDCVTPSFSLYAFAEIREALSALDRVQLIVPPDNEALELLGTESDRAARNRLQARWLANQCAKWITEKVALRRASKGVPQGAAVMRGPDGAPAQVILGSFAFNTSGLGLTPGNPLNLIQASETADEAAQLAQWFDHQWAGLHGADATDSKGQHSESESILEALQVLGEHRDPFTIYTLMLHRLFQDSGDEMDEERIVKSATGIRNTVVWKKLFKFQRDGVVGAIDKLNRFGGCIIADSVGLGKTFEALAIIKYHELRNDRVLVLAPKRLRDNWTLYKANDKRNILAADRFNYDVLNHTDLSRDGGLSGDIDLSHVNWGNYDLVVIDESHNFRNKATHKGKESRYDRLMRRIIREGVKTRVLMLSATPVNNRLADLRNQIAFATEGDDAALMEHGIASIEATTRKAQAQFNRWLALDEAEKTPSQLVEMLGFDYFTLLDHLTIARSRRHVEKYYGTSETGRFPDRLPPINIKADVDLAGEFRAIRDINQEIRRLTLASYAPLRYVLPHKQAAYDAKYSTQVRGGEGFFRQADREESLIHLLRVNVLKRMESCVSAFTLTVQRQLKDVENTLVRIESHAEALEEIDIADVDIDDPAFEALLVGRKVKVLLGDVDLIRWKQDLLEDRNRLATLLAAARQVDAARDAKLAALRDMIARKCAEPINTHDGKANRKIIVFTAFSDTAHYLYAQLASWARDTLGMHAAVVTGSAGIQATLPGLRKNMGDVLSAFAPRAKERPQEMADEGEIDLLIATDCISEGQNLQDCDWLINYDIHWNPVRIIQRFGRIDRIGSPNQRIQLVNFWPNMELEEYINLEQRVSGRMVLLDISATGEENLIEQQSGNAMNDLEYRRKQLLKLQDTVIDMEDLSTGVAITDLTLTDFRIDLAQFLKSHPGKLDTQPLGAFAVTTTLDADIPPGVIFCLQACGPTAKSAASSDYPLAPHYLVHVGDDGHVLLPYPQAKRILDRLKRLALGRERPDDSACARFDKATKSGEDMRHAQKLLAAAVASVAGKHEERAVASLFTPGGTHAMKGEFAGSDDFEVVAFLVVLPDEQSI